MRTKDGVTVRDTLDGQQVAGNVLSGEVAGSGKFFGEVWRDGVCIERMESPNLIVNQGLVYGAGVALGVSGVTQITSWYVALISGTPTVGAGNTYATPSGWTEVTAYDEATREAYVGAAGSTGVVTNTASVAEFTIASGGATIGGAAIVGGGSAASTKGDTAGGGTLWSAAAFTGGNRVLLAGDLLRITYQFTLANAA
jgi:hypothetical protein